MDLMLMTTEPYRSWMELALFLLTESTLKLKVPPGDGHPVIVIPGYGATDEKTHLMRSFFTDVGYEALPWGMGTNSGPNGDLAQYIQRMAHHFDRITSGKAYSIIGWSLGGVFAREVAKISPTSVRRVVTLGSPINCGPSSASAFVLCALLRRGFKRVDPLFLHGLAEPPPVPSTSIYSRADGVVPWQFSVGERTENIQLMTASHTGMCHNPTVISLVGEILARPV